MSSRLIQLFFIFVASGFLMGPVQGKDALKPSDIPLEAFAQLKTTSAMQLSPDGTHLAYLTAHKGRQVLVIRPLGGETSGVVPAAANAEILFFHWVNDNRLVLSYAFSGEKTTLITRQTRLYGVDRDGKNLKDLFKRKRMKDAQTQYTYYDVPVQIQDDVIDWLPDDPDHILVVLDGDRDGRDEVRKVNVYTGRFKELLSGKRGVQMYATDQQNTIRLAWGYDKSTEINLFKSPILNDWRTVSKTSWGREGFNIINFTKDPKIIYAAGYNEHKRRSIYRIDLETDAVLAPVFSHEQVDYDYIVNHPNTGKPIGVQYTVDKPKIVYFDVKLKSIQKTVDNALPETVNTIVGIQEEKKMYLIHSRNDREPGVYYLLDMINKKMDFISETMPGITPEDMSPVKAVSYQNRDGVTIPGYLTVPKGQIAKNLPLIVYVHGGPQARDTQMFDYTVQFFASRGYAVFQPNFQGSEGYGRAFENAGRQQWGGRMQDDVTDGVHWLIEQGISDPDRMCIAGASYGGYSAAMGLIKTPDLFLCGISTSAVLNMPGLIAFDKRFVGGKTWTENMGLEGADPEKVSPYHRAAEITKPLLIIHAEDDHRVPYKQARNMAKKMKKLKKDVTLVTLKDGDHNMDTEAARIGKLTAMEKFLAKHLNGTK